MSSFNPKQKAAATDKSHRAASNKPISPGECGFKDCTNKRKAGIWKDGGSYMCNLHYYEMLSIRSVWDNKSPDAVELRTARGDSANEVEALLRSEQKQERKIERDQTDLV